MGDLLGSHPENPYVRSYAPVPERIYGYKQDRARAEKAAIKKDNKLKALLEDIEKMNERIRKLTVN